MPYMPTKDHLRWWRHWSPRTKIVSLVLWIAGAYLLRYLGVLP
ncbi:MAG: hypothetical protein ABSA58_22285 [Acetobacteraceae bacterium]|jgi:hypothetical protein